MEQFTNSTLINILLTSIGGLLLVLAFFFRGFITKLDRLDPERMDKMSEQLDRVYQITTEQKYVNENYKQDITKLKDDVCTLNKRYISIEGQLYSIGKKLEFIKNQS